MKTPVDDAQLLSREYTNHSIRSTCISRLDDSGFKARHITALTSHKSESTIKEYSVKCLENKRKAMFEALAMPLQNPKKIKLTQSTSNSSNVSEDALVPASKTQNYTFNLPNDPNDIQLGDIDLLEMNSSDDKLLFDILTQTENYLKSNTTALNPTPTVTTTVQQNTLNRLIPVIPFMYFPNSNVTINYNFGK